MGEEIKEFGIKRDDEERRDGGCGFVFDPKTQLYAVGRELETGRLRLFSGGVASDEDMTKGILREIREESGLHEFEYIEKTAEALSHFHNRLKNVNRVAHATCLLVILKSTNLIPTALEDHEKFELAWATAEEMLGDWKARNQNKDNDHWIYFLEKSVGRAVELGFDKTSNLENLVA